MAVEAFEPEPPVFFADEPLPEADFFDPLPPDLVEAVPDPDFLEDPVLVVEPLLVLAEPLLAALLDLLDDEPPDLDDFDAPLAFDDELFDEAPLLPPALAAELLLTPLEPDLVDELLFFVDEPDFVEDAADLFDAERAEPFPLAVEPDFLPPAPVAFEILPAVSSPAPATAADRISEAAFFTLSMTFDTVVFFLVVAIVFSVLSM